MPAEALLPQDFSALEPFVPTWALRTQSERRDRRLSVAFEDLRVFYDAMMPRMDAILDHLNAGPLDGLNAEEERLLYLTFSLAEIGQAVESFGQPDVPDGLDSRRVVIHDD